MGKTRRTRGGNQTDTSTRGSQDFMHKDCTVSTISVLKSSKRFILISLGFNGTKHNLILKLINSVHFNTLYNGFNLIPG